LAGLRQLTSIDRYQSHCLPVKQAYAAARQAAAAQLAHRCFSAARAALQLSGFLRYYTYQPHSGRATLLGLTFLFSLYCCSFN